MVYSLNLEHLDGRWYAHVAELPGAFSDGGTVDEATRGAAQAIANHLVWSEADVDHGPRPLATVTEIIRSWNYAPDYEVNAFFATDRPPLTDEDVEGMRKLLYLARAELLDSFLGLTFDQLVQKPDPETWSVVEVLRHISTAENWYLDRLGLAHEPAWEMGDTLGRVLLVRQHLLDVLPGLVGDERVTEWNGELWSPRKVVRRTLWHELLHARDIKRVRGLLLAAPGASA
ncbi:MAG: type II toxin-antitoxin system HicB family antitoxin [Anaerolineales bacterium]|nr:type II toxin-antitoxin system HicB family antitoxin [Anaerolineales bacterium]